METIQYVSFSVLLTYTDSQEPLVLQGSLEWGRALQTLNICCQYMGELVSSIKLEPPRWSRRTVLAVGPSQAAPGWGWELRGVSQSTSCTDLPAAAAWGKMSLRTLEKCP